MGSKRKTTTQIVAKIDPRWASELEKTECQVNGGGRDGLQGNSLLLRTDRNPSNFNILVLFAIRAPPMLVPIVLPRAAENF